MCGIIGYIGSQLAIPILLQGLHDQEYRGYDSAGIAVLEEGAIRQVRTKGKVAMLEDRIAGEYGSATIGIGHTRWATHGKPSDTNAHPHMDCHGDIAVVHNGIIENYLELRSWLSKRGHTFSSETDSELLPHMLEHYYEGNLLHAMMKTVERLEGSYATVAFCRHEPRKLVAARLDNPLIIGVGQNNEYYFASDMAALIGYTRDMLILQNGDIAVISEEDGVTIYNEGEMVDRKLIHIDWDKNAARKGGYEHFMLKEIHEEPTALEQSMKGRIDHSGKHVVLPELENAEWLGDIQRIVILGCGTAYHAGLVGKRIMEKMLRIPVEIDLASEFQYRDPIVDEHTLAVVISQSGETLDTLLALRECTKRGAHTIAICNVLDSTISREAEYVLYTWAGPEIAVASTKAYITQLSVLYLLTFYLAERLEKADKAELEELVKELVGLPDMVQHTIYSCETQIGDLAEGLKGKHDVFFIGRGYDHLLAMEGALKLKEISYIHAEAYAAGELKHGTIALIEQDTPVVALAMQPTLLSRLVSNIVELKSRGAFVIGISSEGADECRKVCDDVVELPEVNEALSPIITILPLQLLAYYAAKILGCEIDQPRNLAKSVTVL